MAGVEYVVYNIRYHNNQDENVQEFREMLKDTNYLFLAFIMFFKLYVRLKSCLKSTYFRGNFFSREFIFAILTKFAKFAKISAREIFEKSHFREIRENFFSRNNFKISPSRNSRKYVLGNYSIIIG